MTDRGELVQVKAPRGQSLRAREREKWTFALHGAPRSHVNNIDRNAFYIYNP